MKSVKCTCAFIFLFSLSHALYAQQAKSRADKQFDKAVQLYNRHDFANTLRQLDELIADEPSYARAWLLKGDIYNDLKEFSNAVVSYKKAVEIDSSIFCIRVMTFLRLLSLSS